MFDKSIRFYDAIYHWKDYPSEVRRLVEIIHKESPEARTLLDVACGTGLHLQYLARDFEAEGVDLSEEFLAIAHNRVPLVPLHPANMEGLDLNRSFDVITCLFSSIGYVQTKERLDKTVAAMARHLQPGGLLIIEPWFSPEEFLPGRVGAIFVDEEDLKIARINSSTVDGGISTFQFHYVVGVDRTVSYFTERHDLGLFTRDEYRDAMESAGLRVEYDAEGLMGRGLWIGKTNRAGRSTAELS